MSRPATAEERPEDCATAWFAVLERAREAGDQRLVCRAIAELSRLGYAVQMDNDQATEEASAK